MPRATSNMTPEQEQAWVDRMRGAAPVGPFVKKARTSVSSTMRKPYKRIANDPLPPYPDVDISSPTLIEDAKRRTDAYAALLVDRRKR